MKLCLMVALATGTLLLQGLCHAAEHTPSGGPAERTRGSETAEVGVSFEDQPGRFAANIQAEAARAGLKVMSTSRVTTRTNEIFFEKRQQVAAEATESQLLDFLRNLVVSNSVPRIQSLGLRPNPEHTLLHLSLVITANYRLNRSGQTPAPDAGQTEDRMLRQRDFLRQAALDCYTLTKAALPTGWTLENLNFQDGQRLSLNGLGPANELRSFPEVQAKLQQARGHDGKDLFLPASGEGSTRMVPPDMKAFAWEMQFNLRQPELR